MCGRFTLTKTEKDLRGLVEDLDSPFPVAPRYNITPSQPILAILNRAHRTLAIVQWGLVPHWAKDSKIGHTMINARVETITEKPSFRSCFKSKRCLIFADGFYEWARRPGEKHKTPMYIRLKSGNPFAFAGLWSQWQGGDGTELTTAAIITTRANHLIKTIHHRMPVILPPTSFGMWLNTETHNPPALMPLLAPHPPGDMTMYPVSRYVNNVANDGPKCIEREGNPKQQDLFDK